MSKRKKGKAREVRIKPESDTEIKTELDSGSEFDEVELALQLPSVKRARNPTGKNQYAPVPPLEDLEGLLCQYHTQNHHFKYQDYIDALGRDHGITIGRSTLAKYLGALGLSTSARGNRMPNSDKTQIILDELAKDPLQTRGPRVVKEALDLVGHKISRDYISAIMHDFEAEGFEKRQPHAKKALARTPLTSVGPDEEWSVDGHDKLDVAGFGIYGIRDKWGKRYHHYRVVPSNRYAAVVGVLYLECVKKRGGVPVQVSSDRGSEVRDAYAFQKSLREAFAPDLLDSLVPAWKFLPSPRNITIESSWRSLFYTWGVNVLHFFEAGLNGAFFEPGNYVHEQTSNWIWFPAVQRSLDNFCLQQNNHRIRKQSEKALPSGGTPEEFYRNPAKYGGRSCLIPVDEQVIDELLQAQRAEADVHMRHVDPEFDVLAQAAYAEIDEPEITVENAWTVFQAMIAKLEE